MAETKIVILTAKSSQSFDDKLEDLIQTAGSNNTVSQSTWLNSKDVAKILGISTWTLRSYRTDGKIAFYQFNRKILYKESDVVQALENFRVPSFSTFKSKK